MNGRLKFSPETMGADFHRRSAKPQPGPTRRQFQLSHDSNASFASSQPSTISVAKSSQLYTDRAFQFSTIALINHYLSSHSSPVSLSTHPISSTSDITAAIDFLLQKLDYPSTKLDDDLLIVLKSLNYPSKKVTKSILRAPNTSFNWPSILATIHGLVEIAVYKEQLAANFRAFLENNILLDYAFNSYNDDEAVEVFDREITEKMERKRNNMVERVKILEAGASKIRAKAEAVMAGPTELKKLGDRRSLLETKLRNSDGIIAEYNRGIEAEGAVVEAKRKEMEIKAEEKKLIEEENGELKRTAEEHNGTVAERLESELQAVERDIGEIGRERNMWEEKKRFLDATNALKLKELEAIATECNQAVWRLRLGNGFHYKVNGKGITTVEVMGLDYKSIVKPQLETLAIQIKRGSVEKLKDLKSLQQELLELEAKVEAKRNQVASLQSYSHQVEALV